ncbi:TnsD family transposase [Virgibacillus sp. DJP39]|uniref:TnsD family transposase n=1 Tax=Virgibacillus sp. DJP39 TaxID=3409790 RepID=UPI003BB5F9DF
MVHWFPTPYPDELLYSIFSRYHVRSGNTSPKMTTEDLFGKRTIRSVIDLPANLDVLLTGIDYEWDADYFITYHTMYPYYAAFLLPQQAEQVAQSMKSDMGGSIHTRTGVAASSVKTKTSLWVCHGCIEEDTDAYGETYWHRTHQAPGVVICPKHEVALEETKAPLHSENQHDYVVLTPSIERTQVDLTAFNDDEKQLLLEIAQLTESLLVSSFRQSNPNTIRDKYLALLKQKGYASPNGFIKRKNLYQDFQIKYSEKCLELLQSPVDFVETNWLTMIFQKHRKSFHPIRHLLVMLLLKTDLDHLLNKKEYQPFGSGPWLCLNTACPSYRKPIVSSLTIMSCYDTGRPVGTFHCKCGFVFSRRGPDNNIEDRYRIGTIKEFGEVWKAKLTELVHEGKSLTGISKKLHADRATVKKYASLLDLNVSWKPPKFKQNTPKETFPDYERQLMERKSKWLTLQEMYPEKSKTELRKNAPDIYAYLYRYGRDWLYKNSPIMKRTQPPNQRVNWEKRDEKLLGMVKDMVRTWDSNCVKPTRITVTAIGKRLNKQSLFGNNADKLPKTMDYIHQVKEDVESFQMRRVAFIVEKMEKDNEPIIEWQVYNKAGLNKFVSNEVKRLISLKVTEYKTVY